MLKYHYYVMLFITSVTEWLYNWCWNVCT